VYHGKGPSLPWTMTSPWDMHPAVTRRLKVSVRGEIVINEADRASDEVMEWWLLIGLSGS